MSMERAVTAVVAGWCVARLCHSGARYLYSHLAPSAGASDYDIGGSLLSSVIPMIATTTGFIAAVVAVRSFVPDPWLRSVQVLDVAGVVALLAWMTVGLRSRTLHPAPDGVLEIELRSPRDLLIDSTSVKRTQVYFGNGRAEETAHTERIREEDGTAILPVEMKVSEHRGWSVVVRRNTDVRHNFWDRYWFDLGMPESPDAAVPWSNWIQPTPKHGWDVANDVALRYRWVAP
jgi:hypothetical protein